jgi:SagB-type dehydrogenase family enzyme
MSDRITMPAATAPSQAFPLLRARRSTKRLQPDPIDVVDAAEALWAAAGATGDGHRTSPSAHAVHPVSVTLIAGAVTGFSAGAYGYESADHTVVLRMSGDHRERVAALTLDADWLAACPALLVLSAELSAARRHFAHQSMEHGERFVWIEVGHVAQNVYLWAADRGLGTCLVAGLDDDLAQRAGSDLLPAEHALLGILPLGRTSLRDSTH